jgi:signal transduction histidine kinase
MVDPVVLILEDEPRLRDVLVRALRAEGFDARGVGTAHELLTRVAERVPDTLVIDIGLADGDGRDVCQALRARGVVAGGKRVGTVVSEVSLKPYERTAQTALIASVVLGVVVLLVVALAAHVLISGALRPVSHMTEQAATWSETDTGRRFDLGSPTDELTKLAATLDGLLDRVASSLRHEQRFSAEISHELRTPLANVIAEAQLALRHPRSPEEDRAGYERVLASAQQMARTLETLVAAARVEARRPQGTGHATAAARSAADGCAAVACARGRAYRPGER